MRSRSRSGTATSRAPAATRLNGGPTIFHPAALRPFPLPPTLTAPGPSLPTWVTPMPGYASARECRTTSFPPTCPDRPFVRGGHDPRLTAACPRWATSVTDLERGTPGQSQAATTTPKGFTMQWWESVMFLADDRYGWQELCYQQASTLREALLRLQQLATYRAQITSADVAIWKLRVSAFDTPRLAWDAPGVSGKGGFPSLQGTEGLMVRLAGGRRGLHRREYH